MARIYELHDKAFQQVSAYVIAKRGDRVATIAFKFPRDGAGRLYVYVHWLGIEMVRGHASGYGYDKQSAACSAAASRVPLKDCEKTETDYGSGRKAFVAALTPDDGFSWDRRLRDAGFDVWQAV